MKLTSKTNLNSGYYSNVNASKYLRGDLMTPVEFCQVAEIGNLASKTLALLIIYNLLKAINRFNYLKAGERVHIGRLSPRKLHCYVHDFICMTISSIGRQSLFSA